MLKLFNRLFFSHQVCTGFDTLPLKEEMLNYHLHTFYTATQNIREEINFWARKEDIWKTA